MSHPGMQHPAVEVCGAQVIFKPPTVKTRFDRPLIYRWLVREEGKVTMVYIGKARGGQSRPLRMYSAVARDLRLNRDQSKITDVNPLKTYFRRQPWGYRWVHHQLEDAAYRMTELQQKHVEITLEFVRVNVPLAALHKFERHEINKAKRLHPGAGVVANDEPCMIKQPTHRLSPVWR